MRNPTTNTAWPILLVAVIFLTLWPAWQWPGDALEKTIASVIGFLTAMEAFALGIITERYWKRRTSRLEPNWVMPPGDILKGVLHERHYTVEDDRDVEGLARAANVEPETMRGILDGTASIDFEIACKLFQITSISPETWLNMQHVYDVGRARGKTVLR